MSRFQSRSARLSIYGSVIPPSCDWRACELIPCHSTAPKPLDRRNARSDALTKQTRRLVQRQEIQDGGRRPRGARRDGTGIGRGDRGRIGSGRSLRAEPSGNPNIQRDPYHSVSRHGREEGTLPASGPHVEHEHSIPHPRARYPLNSKRLTAWHLRALAQALELPTTGSPDLLRQCIEAAVDRDHEHQNVVVTVKESLKTECIVALADLEFLVSEPVYRDARRVRFEEDAQSAGELHAIRQQLEEAHHQLEMAAAREEELQGTHRDVRQSANPAGNRERESKDQLEDELRAFEAAGHRHDGSGWEDCLSARAYRRA